MGLFRVTLLPEDKALTPLVLCDSGDPLPTMNIRLNTKPVYEYRNLAFADYAMAYFRGNRRNTLSFSVTRTSDENDRKFAGPAAAIIYALRFTSVLPGLSRAKIEIRDSSGSGLFYMANTAAEQTDLADARGVKLGYTFVLNGAEISTEA